MGLFPKHPFLANGGSDKPSEPHYPYAISTSSSDSLPVPRPQDSTAGFSEGTATESPALMIDSEKGSPTTLAMEMSPIPNESSEEERLYGTPRFWAMFFAMLINVVMFGLDQLIVTVAVPQIVDEFKALEKLAWLNTGFFVPCAAGILIYSQMMTIWSPRWVYLCALTLFEIGNAVCGSASSMDVVIFGRALTGLGGAGMWNATYLILTEVVPFAKRGPIFSVIGGVYVLSTVMGTLVGGAFTSMSHSGWRWCFYVNLPIGGVTIAMFALVSPALKTILPFNGQRDERVWWKKFLSVDWIGALFPLAFVCTFAIATQWGGITYEWHDGRVIGCFVASAVTLSALIVWSWYMGDQAMIPLSLFKSVHFTASTWVSFLGFGSTVIIAYYLSVYFQALKQTSPIHTGVLLIAMQGPLGVALLISTKIAERTGYTKVQMVIGATLAAVSMGTMTTIGKDTTIASILGREVVAGIGFGLILNLMTVIVQAEFVTEKHITLHATNVFNFWGFVGRIFTLSIATNIFENKLKLALKTVPDMTPAISGAVLTSPTALWTLDIPVPLREALTSVYATAIGNVWWVTTTSAILLLIACLQLTDIRCNSAAEAAETAEGHHHHRLKEHQPVKGEV